MVNILNRCAVAVVVALYAAAVQATIITGTESFTASGFGAGAPTDPVFGTVTYSFNNAANFQSVADGGTANGSPVHVSVSGLNLPGSWVPVLTYVHNGTLGGVSVSDVLGIGDILNGTLVLPSTNDWRVAFDNISTRPTFREFTYSTTASPTLFVATTGSVPEPGTLGLLGLAFAGAAAARRRRST